MADLHSKENGHAEHLQHRHILACHVFLQIQLVQCCLSEHPKTQEHTARSKERQRLSPAMQEAWDWVASLEQVDAVKFHLASSFPRKVFTDEEQAGTLTQLGLAPQAALFVQVADE